MAAGGNAGKGRPKGSKNKDTIAIEEKLRRYKHDPVAGMIRIAQNLLPCGVCRGKLKTKYALPYGRHSQECHRGIGDCICHGIGERACQSCYGTGYEACSPALRGQMEAELVGYIHHKLKAVELSGSVGLPDLAAILRERRAARLKL